MVANHILYFLKENAGISIRPSRNGNVFLKGNFGFKRTYQGKNEIEAEYEIKITIPEDFPKKVPVVEEVGNKIPKNGEYHVNPNGTLCLGSPIRLLKLASEKPTLSEFVELTLIPHLYACTYKLRHGGSFILGELAHGKDGEIEDYEDLFQVSGKSAVLKSLIALGTKKRIANKRPCPCDCGLRLGRCKTHLTLNSFRKLAPRIYYRNVCFNLR